MYESDLVEVLKLHQYLINYFMELQVLAAVSVVGEVAVLFDVLLQRKTAVLHYNCELVPLRLKVYYLQAAKSVQV